MDEKVVNSAEEFIHRIKKILGTWSNIDHSLAFAWFRGLRKEDYKLRPRLLGIIDKIKDKNQKKTFENDIVREFRMRSLAVPTDCRGGIIGKTTLRRQISPLRPAAGGPSVEMTHPPDVRTTEHLCYHTQRMTPCGTRG